MINVADVVLFYIIESLPQGKSLDISEACPVWKSPSSVEGTNDFKDTAGSDVLVLTAGFQRKPGMSRDNLLLANADVIRSFVKGTAGLSPESILIMVTLVRYTTVKGIPITALLDRSRINSLIEWTKNGGAGIVSFLKTGSAYYALAASSVEMIRAILRDEKRLLLCSAFLDGPYGISGLFVGVPVYIGKNGVEKILELQLTEGERELLEKSAASVKNLLSLLKK